MKVLVLGGSGLVGKNLEDYVKNESVNGTWTFVGSKDADLTIYEEVVKLFDKHQPTYVINLAAYVGGLYKNMEEGVEFFTKNILIIINVMKASIKVKKLISIMSSCIFPDDITYPITEDKLHSGPPHCSNEGYSYAKRMVDVLSRTYNKQYKTNYVTVIPGNLYGPYDNFNLGDSHVLPALIHKCYLSKQTNNSMIVNGTGSPLRQFTYAPDLAKLLVWTLENYDEDEPIILSIKDEHSIKTVVDIIRNAMDYKGEIMYDTTKSDGQFRKTISNAKLQKYIDFQFTSIEEGIEKTVKWFQYNYRDIRK
jgi:GDP-L-fucose synthase